MQSWPEKHPGWEYTIYDNDFLTGYPFRLRKLIDEYFWRGLYAGVQDMMRYEILYEFGGFLADADAICLHPVDDLLTRQCAYTVYDRPEGDQFRGVCPVLACAPGNPFLKEVIDRLATREPWELRKAEVSTGNRFLMSVIRDVMPGPEQLQIWPTHYFIPWHKSDPDTYYSGPDKVYAEQKWASSMYAYNREGGPGDIVYSVEELAERHDATVSRLLGRTGKVDAPGTFNGQDRHNAARHETAKVRELLESADWKADLLSLNKTLESTQMAKERRFHGMHFYRHMQNQPLTKGRLRSRSSRIRECLLGWLASARSALILGIDTGHLPLAALHLSPDLRMTALDGCRWRYYEDKNPPRPANYVPAAASWLSDRFPDRFSITLGSEPDHLSNPDWWSMEGDAFDLIMVPLVHRRTLHALSLISRRVKPGTVVVCASPFDRQGFDQTDRLGLQGLTYEPLCREDFGRDRGSYSAAFFRPQD
jgi:hypothetical protein